MKKSRFKLVALVMAVCCAFLCTACLDDDTGGKTDVAVTSVTLNKEALTLKVGEESTLTVTVSPDNATNKAVTWSALPEGIVTVEGGKVKAIKEGTAVVTATADSKSAACVVTVTEATKGEEEEEKEEDPLSVLLLINSKEHQFYTQHFKKVASEMDITIDYEGRAAANYYDSLKANVAKGDVPDIFCVRPSDIREFLDKGLIADISEEIAAYSERLDDMNAFAKGLYRYDTTTHKFGEGKTYALPKDLSVQQLGYNVNLIYKNRTVIWDAFEGYTGDYPKYPAGHADAGKLKMPWDMDWSKENYTWGQYLIMAKALSEKGGTKGPGSGNEVFGCDFPNYEILTWSFGGELLTGDHVNVDSDAFKQAAKYLADLRDKGAANRSGATYGNFVAMHNVCFYSEISSFDIIDFDNYLPLENGVNVTRADGRTYTKGWDVMPFPVPDAAAGEGKYAKVKGSEVNPTDWQSVITTAGYAVSASCKDKKRAVEVIMSLYTEAVQEDLVAERKLQLPLFEGDVMDSFLDTAFDAKYSPLSRSIFMDVISGKNGQVGAAYACYDTQWQDLIVSDLLEGIYEPDGKNSSADELENRYTDAFIELVQTRYDQFNK